MTALCGCDQILHPYAHTSNENPEQIHGEVWLGGLDSNQDSQLQRLMYCQLYDLPAEGGETNGP
jgi:hypothetical protein